jgi:mRNA-degrading endonuclease RelE of RelBE toxin-antitoxin system
VEPPQWELEISHPALHDLRRLSPEMKRRVLEALDGLIVTPWKGDIRKLEGRSQRYCLRVGDWRVIFQPDEGR